MTTVLVTLLAVVVAILVVLVCGMLRNQARIARALGDLTRAREATSPTGRGTDLSGCTPEGAPFQLAVSAAARPTMLVFLTSTCTTCAAFWRALATPRGARAPGGARIVVVTKGEEAERPARLRELAPSDIPVVMSADAWAAYDVPVAPHFVYLDARGSIVAAGPAATLADAIAASADGVRRP